MTPAARIAAAIELLDAIEFASNRPADAVANDFFRSRRYIGSGDRRAVSERVWNVLRARRRLGWWLNETRQRNGEMTSGVMPRPAVSACRPINQRLVYWLLPLCCLRAGRCPASGKPFPAVSSRLPGWNARKPPHWHRSRVTPWIIPPCPMLSAWQIPDWLLPRLTTRFGATLRAEITAL